MTRSTDAQLEQRLNDATEQMTEEQRRIEIANRRVKQIGQTIHGARTIREVKPFLDHTEQQPKPKPPEKSTLPPLEPTLEAPIALPPIKPVLKVQ